MAGRVYIVGAGASRDDTKDRELPMPLATEFFNDSYLHKYWPPEKRRKNPFNQSALAKILRQYFRVGNAVGSKPGVHINVEEVYSFIESGLESYSNNLGWTGVFTQAKAELLSYITHLIRYIPWGLDSPKLHTAIVQSLDESDSIFTFNWDLLFDDALSKTAVGQKLLEGQASLINPFARMNSEVLDYDVSDFERWRDGYFLKLHGSINLAHCKNRSCVHHSVPFRFGIREEMPEFRSCRACGSGLEVLIIPPYVHKSYRNSRLFQLQADIATNKLSRASEIILIGYSLPAFDFHARTLLRLARLDPDSSIEEAETFLSRVVIVDPSINNEAYIEKVDDVFALTDSKRAYGHAVEVVLYSTVDDFLESAPLAPLEEKIYRPI